jgi:hypothetical protein
MISRKSTIILADTYHKIFVSYDSYLSLNKRVYRGNFNEARMYDYLFLRDYDSWFLNLIKTLKKYDHTRELKEFIMKLHTGESLFISTKDWTWEQRQKLGQRYIRDLSRDIIKATLDGDFLVSELKELVSKLRNQLEMDGYIYQNDQLYVLDKAVINEQEEKSYLLILVEQAELLDPIVVKHHIELAEEHFVNSKWEDSIVNSRKFLEAIFQQLASLIHNTKYNKPLSDRIYDKPFEVRNFLENEGFLEQKEKEAFSKVYGLLSETGAHPNIASKDQARLMWHLALTISQFVILRFESNSK